MCIIYIHIYTYIYVRIYISIHIYINIDRIFKKLTCVPNRYFYGLTLYIHHLHLEVHSNGGAYMLTKGIIAES